MASRKILLFAVVMSVLASPSCRQNQQAGPQSLTNEPNRDEVFGRLVTESFIMQGERQLPVIDSLEAAGVLSPAKADYLRAYSYENAGHTRVAEQQLTILYENLKPEDEGWDFYLNTASLLASVRMTMCDQTGSLAVATDALHRAEEAGELTDRWKVRLLWSIASCQGQLDLKESEQTCLQVLEMLKQEAREGGEWSVENLLAWTHVLFQQRLEQEKYAEAEDWLDQAYDALHQATDSSTVTLYTGELAMGKVRLLDARGEEEQARALFQESLPVVSRSPVSLAEAAMYLLSKEEYGKAADLFAAIDKDAPSDNRDSEMNLDNIGLNIIPRLKANLGAGRRKAVEDLARQIADNYEQALSDERDSDATELAFIYDTQGKERQIAEQEARLSKQQLWGAVIIFGLLTLFFIIYTINRHHAARRLSDMKAAQERIESELRIARNIQMSMVPEVFPEREGLDMYARMMPAREVGGDLYGYVLQDDSLYFCVGDVSGKGVPASLFMAQCARLFRTFAAEGMMPDRIATRMNKELAEGNESNMFVTMFIGLLHLGSGRLDYCNCGHNAPVLDGRFLEMKHANQMIGVWEDDPFAGEHLDDIRGHQLLVYTDGLNEAENSRQERLGDGRILELMAGAKALSSRQVIDRLCEAVAQHRAGTEPNDDLTLMCLKLTTK